MSGKRINPRLAKLHRSYSVEEAARVLGVHKNSVLSWIKSGLPIVDSTRPILILGRELRGWLERRRNSAKRPCPPGTLYCAKCREPKPPALGMVEYTPRNAVSGTLRAFCSDCDTMMHRHVRQDSIGTVMPNLDVQITEAPPRIIERAHPSLNCDKAMEA
ncbi:helix-turn-helix domain-containing protein [Parasphingopyxis lamellibrachiae]|uniref:Helix-turn-helix protein n=1 Tax=Parasphingopyxis lamellibrachiae TaxID=680125 RepID=A0A3D9FIT9_9SPHN|nr:helix-turn-helix protein [Parasphingopyxis lamellibrachiae]